MKKVMSLVLALMMLLSTFAFADDGYSGTITISLYAQTGVEEAWNAVAEAYEALNPGVDVVVDLKPEDSYADWVKAMFQSYEETTPEADIVYGNMAGSDRNDKMINFLDYLGEKSPYSDYEEWTEQFAFEMQDYEAQGTIWDCISISGVQVLWFYNVDIFEKVGVQPPPRPGTSSLTFATSSKRLAISPLRWLAISTPSGRSRWAGWLRPMLIRPPVSRSKSSARRTATSATILTSTALSSMIPPMLTTTTK